MLSSYRLIFIFRAFVIFAFHASIFMAKNLRQILCEIRQHRLRPGAAQNDTAYTRGNIPAHQRSDGDTGVPLVIPPTNPSQPPEAQGQAAANPQRWQDDRKFILEGFAFIVLCAYTWFACLQWLQIRYTNGLTARALDGSDKTLSLTLGKMQAQIDTANAQYGQSILQTGQTTTIATNSGTQASATANAAGAARDAANTAEKALHTTERAYVVTGAPVLNASTKIVAMTVINAGHIPSGKVRIVVHEATIPVTPNAYEANIQPIESSFHVKSPGGFRMEAETNSANLLRFQQRG